MSSTSQKHRDFVAEPMGDKPVRCLAGIGDALGKKLEDKGFDKISDTGNSPKHGLWVFSVKYFTSQVISISIPIGPCAFPGWTVLGDHLLQAYVVLGQFLVLRKDEELFREWLKDTCGANVKQARDCFSCLKEWCDAFL